MKPREFLVVGVVVVLAFMLGDCNGSSGTHDWRIRAETAEAALPAMGDQVRAAKAVSDSTAREAAAKDSMLSVQAERMAEYRKAEQGIARRQSQLVATTADSIRARVDSATAVLVTEMELAHRDALEASENRVRSLEVQLQETEASRILFRDLAAKRLDVIVKQEAVIASQDIALDAWRRAASPSIVEQITGAIPEVGLGLSAGLIGGYLIGERLAG